MERTVSARFSSTHYNLPYSERTLEKTWRLEIALVDAASEDVPPGTEVWIELPDED